MALCFHVVGEKWHLTIKYNKYRGAKMYTSYSQRARKYRIPRHIEMNTSYGHIKWGVSGLVIWTKKHGGKIIGYPISRIGVEIITKKLNVTTNFNVIGMAKITDYLLSWTKEQWETFHLMDAISGSDPGITVFRLVEKINQYGRKTWTHEIISMEETIFILPEEDRYRD